MTTKKSECWGWVHVGTRKAGVGDGHIDMHTYALPMGTKVYAWLPPDWRNNYLRLSRQRWYLRLGVALMFASGFMFGLDLGLRLAGAP